MSFPDCKSASNASIASWPCSLAFSVIKLALIASETSVNDLTLAGLYSFKQKDLYYLFELTNPTF